MKLVNVHLIAEKREAKKDLIIFKALVKLLQAKNAVISIQWAQTDKP